ncbi:GrpB family protein [Candidatus Thorarchaeota archaeon]|nr:MAG: GrpB family protein [Candidatus Thorarchaeota archaeon]
MEPVVLVPHDPAWSEEYQREKSKIRDLLGPLLITTYHVGSTSVPDIKAKPIVDILALVRDIDRIERFNEEFEAMGYTLRGEAGIEGRRFFRKHTHPVGFHLHFYDVTNDSVRKYIDFRDYLIAHPGSAEEYEELKMRLAAKYGDDRPAYTEAKAEFIQEILETALDWKASIFSANESPGQS